MLARETGLSLRMVAVLAESGPEWVAISLLAGRLGISRPYAAKLANRMRAAGLLDSLHGSRGGVRLTPAACAASLFDFAEALGDPILDRACFTATRLCDCAARCEIHPFWSATYRAILDEMRRTPVVPACRALAECPAS